MLSTESGNVTEERAVIERQIESVIERSVSHHVKSLFFR